MRTRQSCCEHHMLCFQTSLYSGKEQTNLRGLNEANKRSNVTARMGQIAEYLPTQSLPHLWKWTTV